MILGFYMASKDWTRPRVVVYNRHYILNGICISAKLFWMLLVSIKKGSPVHVVPTCVGSGEGSDRFGSYVRSLSLHLCNRLFLGLEPMISWSQGNNFTTAPGTAFATDNIYCMAYVLVLNYFEFTKILLVSIVQINIVVALWPWGHGSSPGNNLLQKCRERLRT
jgi:hypothetical protein